MSQKQNGSGFGLVFTNASFMILLVAQLISYLGDRLDQITLLELARKTEDVNSAVVANNILICLVLPFVLLAAAVGPVVDRFSRKGVLIVTSACQGLVILSVPFFRDFAFVQENAVAMIYLVIFLIGSFTAFFTPAKTSLIPEIVPRRALMAANSLTTFAGTIMTLLGTFVAAGLIALHEQGRISLDLCFYIDAATYFVSGAMIFAIVVPETREVIALRRRRAERRESFRAQIASALRYAGDHRRARGLIWLTGCFSLTGGFVFSIINGKTLIDMGAETSAYGQMMGVFGLAVLVGGVAMALLRRRVRRYEEFVARCFAGVTVIMIAMAWSGPAWIPVDPETPGRWDAWLPDAIVRYEGYYAIFNTAVLPFVGVGLIGGALMVYITTMLQSVVPMRLHGRMFALNGLVYNSMLIASMALGSVLLGWIKGGGLTTRAVSLAVAALAAGLTVGTVVSAEWLRFKWLRRLAWSVLRPMCGLEVSGREHVPARGPLIIAGNHSSWIDTICIGVSVPHVTQYMASETWYYRWWLNPVMRFFSVIPVPYGRDVSGAVKTALDVVKRRRVLALFPEGRLSDDGTLYAPRGGVGLIAERTGAPILPVAIHGAHRAWGRKMKYPRPAKVRVTIGEPIDPTGKDRQQITREVMGAIADMLGQPYPTRMAPYD